MNRRRAALALDVLAVDAVVPDERVGHRDDLALVRGVGEDLLVAGHRGVEHDLALGRARRTERAAGEDRAIFQRQLCYPIGLVAHRGGSIGSVVGERENGGSIS
jgi:hypothetical protein